MATCQSLNCHHCPIAICLHCQEYLCVEHLLEHNELMICQANMFCDKFNELTEKIDELSCDTVFVTAEEDLTDWVNDQMKHLDKVYEQKLFELKQMHNEVKEKIVHFKETQGIKILDIRRLFNSKLNKQISLEQLNQMKTAVEQLEKDLKQFHTGECAIKLGDNDQVNHSSRPKIQIQFQKDLLNTNKSNTSQLNVNAKPFDFISKDSVSFGRQ